MNDQELITSFLAYLRAERCLAPNTVASYEYDLQTLQQLLPNGVAKATAEELGAVFILLQNHGKASTLARKMSTLRHFYAYARRKRAITASPLRNIPLPKIRHRLPKPISTPDFEKLLNILDTTTLYGLRDYAILRVFDSCGLRNSELVTLEPNDLHLDEGYIVVRAGKGDKDRFVPIDEPAANAVRDYLHSARPKLYPNESRVFPLTRQFVWMLMQALCRRAGIVLKHPHQLRHRFGSEMTKAGLEVQEVSALMGHSSVDTTMQYVGLDLTYVRKIFRSTHPRAVCQ